MGREPGSICDVRAHLVCLGVPVVLGCLMIRFMLISLSLAAVAATRATTEKQFDRIRSFRVL